MALVSSATNHAATLGGISVFVVSVIILIIIIVNYRKKSYESEEYLTNIDVFR